MNPEPKEGEIWRFTSDILEVKEHYLIDRLYDDDDGHSSIGKMASILKVASSNKHDTRIGERTEFPCELFKQVDMWQKIENYDELNDKPDNERGVIEI